MLNTENHLTKSLPFAKAEALYIREAKFTAVLQTLGTTVRSVLNSKQTSNRLGEKNSSRKINIM